MRALAGLKKRWKLPRKVTQLTFILPVKCDFHCFYCAYYRENRWKNISISASTSFFFESIDKWCGCDFLLVRQQPPRAARLCLCVYVSVCLDWVCCSLEPFLCLSGSRQLVFFIKQAVKSASYQLALANVAVINSACLLSLTEDYPEVYGWFTEVADTPPIFLAPVLCMSVFVVCSALVSGTDCMSCSTSVVSNVHYSFDRDSLLICYTRLMVTCGSDICIWVFIKEIYIFQENMMGAAGSNAYKYQYLWLLTSPKTWAVFLKTSFYRCVMKVWC